MSDKAATRAAAVVIGTREASRHQVLDETDPAIGRAQALRRAMLT